MSLSNHFIDSCLDLGGIFFQPVLVKEGFERFKSCLKLDACQKLQLSEANWAQEQRLSLLYEYTRGKVVMKM